MPVHRWDGASWVEHVGHVAGAGTFSDADDNLWAWDGGSWQLIQPVAPVAGGLLPPINLVVAYIDHHEVEIVWDSPDQPAEDPTAVQYRIPEITSVLTEVPYPINIFNHVGLQPSTAYTFEVRYVVRVAGEVTKSSEFASIPFVTNGSPVGNPGEDPGGTGGDTIIPIGPVRDPANCEWHWELFIWDDDGFGWETTGVTGVHPGDQEDFHYDLATLEPTRMYRFEFCEWCFGAPADPPNCSFGEPFVGIADWDADCGGIPQSASSGLAVTADCVWAIPHVCVTTDVPRRQAMFDKVSHLEVAKGSAFSAFSLDSDGEWGMLCAVQAGPVFLAPMPAMPLTLAPGEDFSFAFDFAFAPGFDVTPQTYTLWTGGLAHTVKIIFGESTAQLKASFVLNGGGTLELFSTPFSYEPATEYHTVVVRWDADGTKDLFINGTLRDSDSTSAELTSAVIQPYLSFQLQPGMRTRRHYGWARALTTNEIANWSAPDRRPFSAALIGRYDLYEPLMYARTTVMVRPGLLFLGTDFKPARVIDVTDPLHLIQHAMVPIGDLAVTEMEWTSSWVARLDDNTVIYPYILTDNTYELRTLDLTNPASPVVLDQWTSSHCVGEPRQGITDGRYVLFVDDHYTTSASPLMDHLVVLDCADPSNIQFVSATDTGMTEANFFVAFDGRYVYVAETRWGEGHTGGAPTESPKRIAIYDWANRALPVFQSFTSNIPTVISPAVPYPDRIADYLFCQFQSGSGDLDLGVVDVRNKAAAAGVITSVQDVDTQAPALNIGGTVFSVDDTQHKLVLRDASALPLLPKMSEWPHHLTGFGDEGPKHMMWDGGDYMYACYRVGFGIFKLDFLERRLPAAIQALDPQAYLKLDEPNATEMHDSSGLRWHPTSYGGLAAQIAPGADGADYMQFGGGGGGDLNLTDNYQFNVDTPGYTYFALIKPASLGSGRQHILSKDSLTWPAFAWTINDGAGGRLTGILKGYDSLVRQGEYADVLTAGWQAVALVVENEAVGTRMRMYRNSGTQLTTTQIPATSSNPHGSGFNEMRVGWRHDRPAGQHFVGAMAHVAMFRGSRSAAEIATLMDAAHTDGWF